MNTSLLGRIGCFVSVLLLAGCQHPPSTGKSSVQFIDTSRDPLPQRKPTSALPESSESVIEAQARGPLAPPQYPHDALLDHTGRVVVPMRIVVGTQGLVTGARLRPGMFSTFIPRYSEFAHAIEEAVATWRFTAARMIVSKPETATAHGYSDSYPVEMYFDIDFTFEESARTASKFRRAE